MSNDDVNLICPITHEYFRDPVIAEDGRLYEREAITRWINEHGTSPFTRQVLNINHLQPDDVIRQKAEQRRRLSVSYNQQLDQVQLPPIRTSHNIRSNNRVADITFSRRPVRRHTCCENIQCQCYECRSITCCSYCPGSCVGIIICICILLGIIIPNLVIVIVGATFRESTTSLYIPSTYATPPAGCNALNYNFSASSCLTTFTNITNIYSVTCNTFSYRYRESNFIATSPVTTIIFAFQQTTGYWDIDNITLSNSTFIQNLFRNGDFETGSLSPDYRQCQSTGNISNSSQFNGRYCYSDGTQGQFGYLMQNVSTTPGQSYYLRFYLQNRIGSNSHFAILLDR